MRRPIRLASRRLPAWFALAGLALAGCGATLYDAKGAPVLVPVCADPTPILCPAANACFAEDVDHCGTACSVCQTFDHATTFCDASSLDPSQHACSYTCDPGFERDPEGPGCRCPLGTALCNGQCVAEDVDHCGATCQACARAPARAVPSCDLSADACGFTCQNAFLPSGNSCVCPGAICGGQCVPEDVAHCGPSCLTCIAPAGATPVCTSHACNYVCPAGEVQCSTGTPPQPGCCPVVCPPPAILCPGGASCVTESATSCGATCADCTAIPPPVNGTPACLGPPGQGSCSFRCSPGYLKSNGACVQVSSALPGSLALGASHTCVVTTAGVVMCWGANGSGQLGVGDTADRHAPADVTLGVGTLASFVSAGASHTCAVTASGTVLCWGSNASGQLGQPLTVASAAAPVAVPGITTAVAVAAGKGHTCAILAGGAVSCWGANDQGQLGRSPSGPSTIPLAVNVGGAIATQLATGSDHTCALVATGKVVCWGANLSGQTGQAASAAAAPAEVNGLSAVTVAVGASHSCAAGTFGGTSGAFCWGDDALGQLGVGPPTIPATSIPVAASKLQTGANGVAVGRAHTCAVKIPGATVFKCSGANNASQVGSSPNNPELNGIDVTIVPTIAGGTVDRLVGGGDHTCALSSGALLCWGQNANGQLGDGSVVESAVPVSPQSF